MNKKVETTLLETKSVANFFLGKGNEDKIEISPMKLQKLLYYSQGWHLGFTGQMLFNEQIECWKYGPVVASIFHHFKEFGSDAIDRLAFNEDARFDFSDQDRRYVHPQLPEDISSRSESILRITWGEYKDYSAVKLSNMTHEEGGPWDVTYKENNGNPPTGTDIPVDRIRDHFQSFLESSKA